MAIARTSRELGLTNPITFVIFLYCVIWGVSIARFTDHTIKRLATLCRESAQPLQRVSTLMKSQGTDYYQIYRFLKTERGKDLFATKKSDGLLWVRTRPEALDLIPRFAGDTQISNKVQNDVENDSKLMREKIKTNHRYGKTGPERYQAIGKVLREMDIRPIQDEIGDFFQDYKERIKGAHIYLQPDPEQDLFGQCIELEYKTRFNDESRKKQEVAKYLKIWEQAEGHTKWNNAVLLTLTIDPKIQPNLWIANKKMSKNLNRLMSFLATRYRSQRAKREGKKVKEIPYYRLPYLCVNEFQKNGRLHFHIVFFGISWLIQKQEMVDLWKKYAQGEIVDFKKLRYDKGSGNFEWDGERPPDCNKGEKPHTYLKKYVIKNLYDEKASMQYWVYNTRFYTYSRKYFVGLTFKRISQGLYVFLGVFYGGGMTLASRPGHALGLGRPPDPPKEVNPQVELLDELCRKGTGTAFTTAYDILHKVKA